MEAIIPMAGKGSRFSKEYDLPKPLIPVDGKDMVVQSSVWLPPCQRMIFVCLEEHLKRHSIKSRLLEAFSNAEIVSLPGMTEGQACSCAEGIWKAGVSDNEPLIISNCDMSTDYDLNMFYDLLSEQPDVVVWGFKHTPCSRDNPKAFSWVEEDNGQVKRVSMKEPVSDNPWEDYAMTGTFWFKSSRLFLDGLDEIYKQERTTNGEYYVDNVVDELVYQGKDVRVFEVKYFICWGTPEYLHDYVYWHNYFIERGQQWFI